MKERDILAVFHYVPLHSAPCGLKYCYFNGADEYTAKESNRLVRLPLFYGMSDELRTTVIENVMEFYTLI